MEKLTDPIIPKLNKNQNLTQLTPSNAIIQPQQQLHNQPTTLGPIKLTKPTITVKPLITSSASSPNYNHTINNQNQNNQRVTFRRDVISSSSDMLNSKFIFWG